MQPTRFFARTDIVVTGSNPEMADIVNPRGHLFGSAAYVVAEDDKGNRRELHVVTKASDADALAAADRVAAALGARLAAGKLPVAFDRWQEGRPAYGSDAWVEYGNDDELALERREAEEEAWA